jgi:hypothetical protein
MSLINRVLKKSDAALKMTAIITISTTTFLFNGNLMQAAP